ncbi:MAG: hypothetical protein ACK4Q5_05945 [Saprospiraceae bacterium]
MSRAAHIDFVHETVAQWAAEVLVLLQTQVVKKGIVDTGDLYNSLSYKIVRQAAESVGFQLSFNDYGRILDMTRQKVKPSQINRTVMLNGKKVRVRKNAVSAGWYSKPLYRAVYGDDGLFERLSENFSAWALERVKAALAEATT